MKNLYPRGKDGTLYMKFYFMGELVHRSTQTKDPKLAKLAISKAQKEIYEKHMNTAPKAVSLRFSDAIEEVYKERWVKNNSGLFAYKQAQVILDLLGDILVTEVDTKKVRDVQTSLCSTLKSDTTVNRYMSAFRTVIRHAADSYGFTAPKFTLSKESRGRVRIYTPEEEQLILEWFLKSNTPEMADITRVLLDTGFRLSECLNIGKRNVASKLISEVHFERNTISSWLNKAALARTIPLTTRAYGILKRRGFTPFTLNKSQFNHRWADMREALGLDSECVAHVCRHTCASKLLAAGKGLLVVRDWLGHKDIKTTMIYSHLMPGALDDAVLSLESVSKCVTDCVHIEETSGISNKVIKAAKPLSNNEMLSLLDFARVAELADAPDLGSGSDVSIDTFVRPCD